ncbi:MAG: hypothetical protein KDK36_05945 [Leptospiraceae bacterium]|nr:hypothetical protein [Leptospiraceae bacterium]
MKDSKIHNKQLEKKLKANTNNFTTIAQEFKDMSYNDLKNTLGQIDKMLNDCYGKTGKPLPMKRVRELRNKRNYILELMEKENEMF